MFFKDLGTNAYGNSDLCQMQERKSSRKRSKKNKDKDKKCKAKKSKSKSKRKKDRNLDKPENDEQGQSKKVSWDKNLMPKAEEVKEDMVCDKNQDFPNKVMKEKRAKTNRDKTEKEFERMKISKPNFETKRSRKY